MAGWMLWRLDNRLPDEQTDRQTLMTERERERERERGRERERESGRC